MKKWYIGGVIAIAALWSIDFFSKMWAEDALRFGRQISFFFDIFRFRLTLNEGGVFGIFQGKALVFHIITGLGIVFLGYFFYATKDKTKTFMISMILIMSGALGNFTDRFFRKGVVDFIEMGIGDARYPYIYNMADVFITFGAIFLIFSFREISRLEKLRKEQEEQGKK